MYSAAIFDMDGVIVDNHHVHVDVWSRFCNSMGVDLDESEFRSRFFGKSNRDIMSALLGRPLSLEESNEMGNRKEALYRETYLPHIKPVEGLVPFLTWLKNQGITTAVATSAPPENMHFVLDELNLSQYFDILTDASGVANAKPDPEIYIKSANQLGMSVSDCLVFEDSVSGIQSATAACMTVVALLTTHQRSELPPAKKYVNDFTDNSLRELFVQKLKVD